MNSCPGAATTKHAVGKQVLTRAAIGWRVITSSMSMTLDLPLMVSFATMCCTTPGWFYTPNVEAQAGMETFRLCRDSQP